MKLTMFVAAGISLLAATSGAQMRRIAWSDRAFMSHVAQEGIVQFRLARMARERATTSAVRDFAIKMIQEHSQANDELKTLAASNGVTLDRRLDDEQRALLNKLSPLAGRKFERAYTVAMRDEHSRALADFERESRAAGNPELRRWVVDSLPTLRDHLQMAVNLPVNGRAHRTYYPRRMLFHW